MEFRGTVAVEARPRCPGESALVRGWTCRRDSMVRVCGERSVGGVVGAGGPLLVRMYDHGVYAVGGAIVRCDVTGGSLGPDLRLPLGIVHYLWFSIPACSPAWIFHQLLFRNVL